VNGRRLITFSDKGIAMKHICKILLLVLLFAISGCGGGGSSDSGNDPDPEVNVVDTDSDGVTDDIDNCKYVANSDQMDTDSNGVGDDCDQPLSLGSSSTPWGAATWNNN